MSSPLRQILAWSRRYRVAVLTSIACLAALSAAGIRGLRFDTDVLNLLPHDGRAVPAFRTFVDTFGSADDLYVLLTAPDGHDISEYGDEIDRWSDRLRHTPGIVRVDTGLVDGSRDLTWFADRRLLLAGGRLEDALDRFAGEPLRAALRSSRGLLSVPSADVTSMVRHDPLGLFAVLRDELGSTQAGVNLGVTEGGYVSKDGRSRLLIAKPAQPPFDAQFSRGLMSSLDALRVEMTKDASTAAPRDQDASLDENRPPLQVQFAGGHRIAVETESVIRRESILNTFGSLALILPLLYLVFRSTWLVAVGAIPASVSLVFVLGMLGAAGTTLSTAATASSAMLFGLGVDGVVLLYVAYTSSISGGAEPAAAIDALRGPCASMLLGMWTTAATFYGLKFVDFPSLEQLGTLIGHSMVLCGLLTLVLVPALLPLRKPARPSPSLAMGAFAAWVDRRRAHILVAAAFVTIGFAAAATRLHINPTLDRLRSVTPGAELLQRIGPMFGLPDDVHVVLASGTDLEALLAANERLREALSRAIPAMSVQAPSALLPSDTTQRARHDLIRARRLSADRTAAALADAAREEGFRPGSFDPFRDRLAALLDPTLRLTYEGYRAHGLADVIGRFVARQGDRWLLATYAFPRPQDVAALEDRVRTAAPDATLTGLPLVNRELADRFLPEFVKGLTIGTVVVVVLVSLAFRNVRLSLLSLAPTALGLVWAAGALAVAGVALDLFALFAVVTFVGIGVDYGVHMVHRYQERGHAREAVAELAPVILVAAAITLLGYGTLVTSSYPPLRSIGVVSAVSVVTLAAASLFVLPAALAFTRRGEAA
ncbi:MAG TPA: MMPL family transporter [Vicinamibacterales bacterium]|nr:MMPL family transporter [Vicinamibacterales bacterium]